MVLADKEHIVPGDYQQEAEAQDISIHTLLEDEFLFDNLYCEYVRLYDYFAGRELYYEDTKKDQVETLRDHK
jgi:hypothetical protein